MNKKIKVLIISHNEICYNPRLAKAADYLSNKNFDVTVFNPVTGTATLKTYNDFIKSKDWKIIEFDISKRSSKSKRNWLIVSVLNKAIKFFWCKFNSSLGFSYYLNKGLLGFKINAKFDLIIVHVIDSLPYASKIKSKNKNSILVFDSQEYFKGQYSDAEKCDRMWVETAEKKYIYNADIVISTTDVMKDRLISDYDLSVPVIRVRNTPNKISGQFSEQNNSDTLKLIWVGNRVFYKNRRGLHILLEAVSIIKSNIEFYIQGNINSTQKALILEFAKKHKISQTINFIDAVAPEEIVNSILKYDIGLIGELAQEDNQRLTSSNKLFDYIAAGLAVLAPKVPGLEETLNVFENGLLYEAGNPKELAKHIDFLYNNRDKLDIYKNNSAEGHKKELFWDYDYDNVWSELQKTLSI